MKTLGSLALLALLAVPLAHAQTITTSSPLPSGTVNVFYSTTLSCTNCTNGVWSASGLPANLSINSSSGTISGTPTTTGTYGKVVVALQVIGAQAATKVFSITINAAPLVLQNSSFPSGKVGTVYATQNLVASGGVAPYSYSITSGNLPPGLGINGVTLGGTPTQAGTYQFTLTVTDSQSVTASGNFSITVAGNVIINNTGFPSGTWGVVYPTQTLSASGGVAPYSWSISQGNLPPGLGVSGSTIVGTPNSSSTATASYSFTLNVSDSQQNTASIPTSITINAPSPAITTSSPLPSGTINTQYSTQLSCTNCANGVWNASGLPANLSINSSSGTISGTPTTTGTYSSVVVTLQLIGAGTVTKVFSITINAAPLNITSTSFPAGTINVQYPTQTLSATGGVAPYNWSVTTGLPPGLGISGATILGTPTAAGTYAFILRVIDSQENSASVQVSIVINGTGGGPAINTTTLPNGTVNVPYTAQLACTNCQNYTWSVSSGTLPPGLQVNGQTGIISGTPTASGTSTFQISLTPQNTFANFPTLTQILSITINVGGVAITTTSVPVGSQNTPYSTTLAGTGGTPPYTWSLTSTANDGLTIGANTGVISGTPTATGQFTLSVLLTDSQGLTASRIFTITVSSQLSILTTTLPAGSINVVYPTQTLQAGGGQPPYRWIVVTTGPGNLPPGITLDGVFGRISGTPTASGTFPFELMVTDNNANTATGTISITVGGNIVITPASLPNAAANTAYSQTLTATGGTAPYSWAVTAGSLPVGLTLGASSGIISGTPTLPGSATFTVTATDSTKITGQAAYTLIVSGPVTITTTSLPDGTIGTAYSQTLAATGGTTPYTWAVTTGTLPAGLTLAAATGVISGTPTAAATSSFTVTVTDAGKVTAKQALSIATATALTVTPTSLPAAVVGTAFTQKFTAAGGKAPYTFALTGTLPAGFTFTASTSTIAGTAAVAESGTFTITVTDASGRIVTLPLTLTATVAPLTVAPTTLPTAIVNVPYSQVLTASGGIAPYTFGLSLGALPAGFTFNAATHTISGTATSAVTGNFTITVVDSAGTVVNDGLTLIANLPATPTVTVTLGGPASGFMQQLPVTVAIGTAYPVAISGVLALTFAPSVTPSTGVDDQMIQFAAGSVCTTGVPHTCTINFTIPAGSTTPTFAAGANPTILTGTTAGTITLTTGLAVNGVSISSTTKTIVNASGVPFISSVSFQQTPGGITVTVVGFSSSREMVSGLFHFAPANNVTFTSGDITVPLATPFSTWWTNTTQSNPYGTQFTLTAPFSLSTQSTAVVSVTVTLTNSKGASNAVTLAQ